MEGKIKKIIHIDMDAFFASVEQRDNPTLRGKPIAVGGDKQRGVVAAASYEARKFGVFSAMPSVIAYRKCPEIIFVKPRFDVYKEISRQIRTIFKEHTDLVEPLSLDEAYLDVTENKKNISFAMEIAKEIKAKIKVTTDLNASAGISYNKFLAKIASDFDKPNGFYVITPKMANNFIEKLPIEKFFGVGKVTAKKMHEKGIFSGFHLKKHSLNTLNRWFGKAGAYYYNVARGIDNRIVNPERIRKSLGAERTYVEDILDDHILIENLLKIVSILLQRINKAENCGKTLTLKIKYADFIQITRSKTQTENFNFITIKKTALNLLAEIPDKAKGIRLMGLQISNFDKEEKDVFLGQLEFDFKKQNNFNTI